MEVFHELGRKLGSAITNHFSRDPELFLYVVTEKFGGSHWRDFSSGWDGYDVLGESVDDHHYRIVSLRYR